MNEVEKLYKNAGLECDLPCQKRGVECTNNLYCIPFTAEKQIELIKWCIDNYIGEIFDTIETEWFEEQLSAYINNLWQDLTSEEKEQVKGILE